MPVKKKKSTKKIFQSQSSAHLPTALVAGAAGFIGSHLCDVLIQQNCQVYAIDNWSTGKKSNIRHLLDKKNFVFLEHDLNQPLKSPLPQLDYVFHLAGIEAYINGRDISLETLLVNSLGTRQLLEMAKKQQAKFLLASTSGVFSGFLSAVSLTDYFGTDPSKEEAYSHHEAKRFSEALTFEYLDRYQLDARVVRLGFAFGPRMDLSSGNDIARLLLDIKKNRPLTIPGNGLKPLRPVFISDIVYGLTKAMFSQSSSGQIYTLINPSSITLLNLAYKFKQALPDKKVNIKFVAGSDHLGPASLSDKILASQQNLGWVPKVSLEEGIKQTFKWLQSGQAPLPKDSPSPLPPSPATESISLDQLGIKPAAPPLPAVSPPQKPAKAKKPLPKFNLKSFLPRLHLPRLPRLQLSRRLKTNFLIFFVLLALLIGPAAYMGTAIYAGLKSLNKASQLSDFNQLNQAEKQIQKARRRFDNSRGVLRRYQPVVNLFGLKDLVINTDRLLFIGSQFSQGVLYLSRAGQSAALISEIVFHHRDGNLTQALKQLQINLDQAYNQLSFVESELQSGRQLTSALTVPLSQKLQRLTVALPDIRQKINQARSILPILPSFIAQDSKKTYLLLFQNSAELRPTGGFIGSYGLLTFEKGKLLDFTVEDIYAADGQLKGFVKPPEPIKEYLGQSTWFFRDSNWDPDFSVSAQQAEWFLQKTTGRNVDGVIAVNLPAVKELLKATGPIILTDYNEEVTADNLFDRAEYHSEIDFFPGSTQKKDFLGSLAREIFNRLQTASPTDLLKLAQAVEDGLAKKQFLVYLHDAEAQKILSEQNWAGLLFDPAAIITTSQQPTVVDYAYLVEANLGINKANHFVKRKIQHQLTILKTKDILATNTVVYDNQSPADTWPGGVYRAYLRQYLPSTAKLISIKVGDSKLNLKKDIDLSRQDSSQIIGFPLTVPVKGALEIEVTYRLAEKLKTSQNHGRLVIAMPKQPGIIADTLEVIVNHPRFFTVAAATPQALSSPQVVAFQSDMQVDRVFTIDFVEK